MVLNILVLFHSGLSVRKAAKMAIFGIAGGAVTLVALIFFLMYRASANGLGRLGVNSSDVGRCQAWARGSLRVAAVGAAVVIVSVVLTVVLK